MRKEVLKAVESAYKNIAMADGYPALTKPVEIDIPRDQKFGDFATNLCMVLAKELKVNPRNLAISLKAELDKNDFFVSVEIAGPGFVNMKIGADIWTDKIGEILSAKENFGRVDYGGGEKVMVEFVSANPTGPLHIGHGRGAAVGSAISNICRFAGYDVTSEYYVNDVGLQMDNLGRSLIERTKEKLGLPFEEPTYKGDYLVETATEFIKKYGEQVIDDEPNLLLSKARSFAEQNILVSIKKDLTKFRIEFDNFYSEATLHKSGAVDSCINKMLADDVLYEKDGAIWLRTDSAGDEKDRVVRRANGITTYLAADIAYHKSKFDRGFTKLINIWGADHHGYIPRMRAVVSALGHDPDCMVVRLVQIVSLRKGGDTVAMSTRGGVFTTLEEILDEVGTDATRYFFLMRSADSQLDFDVDLAMKKSDENPVFYIQYAHARCCNIFVTAKDQKVDLVDFGNIDQKSIQNESSLALIKKLVQFPDFVELCARNCEPHHMPNYLYDLSARFHHFYTKNRVITNDIKKSQALLSLVCATRQTLANGLALIGVSAPERM